MPRIRAAERRRAGGVEGQIAVSGRHAPLSRSAVVRAVDRVLRGERRCATLSLAFVGRDRMQALNARWGGKQRPTDVLAFALPGPDGVLSGDIYICPWVAQREARGRQVPLRQELTRLVVHGILHVLGYVHPDGPEREASPMWRRQERYVRALR